jgi:phosphoribosylformylglycinamidine synthase
MVGLVEDLSHITTSYFKDKGDLIYMLGEDREEIGGSEYLKVIHNKVAGDSPELNLPTEKTLQKVILQLIRKKLIKSAHDISEGGIICALAECCIINHERMTGAEVNFPVNRRRDFSYFSETQSRIIVSVSKEKKSEFENFLRSPGSPCDQTGQKFILIGETGGISLRINNDIDVQLTSLADLYFNTIPRIMGSEK